MQAVTITQISPPELENIIESTLKRILSTCFVSAQQPTIKSGTATRQQAADHLNISLPTLAEYTKLGKIQGQRIGRRVLYKWTDLDAALTAINTGGVK
jgi:excisionase family DNA binding protein